MGIEKGRIGVYDNEGKLLDSVVYYTSKKMREKLDQFMEEYSGQEGNYIQVRPYDEKTSRPKKPNLVRVDIPFKTTEACRPPAMYDNLKSIYNIR